MAEEFVEIEQENDPLGILSKKPATPKVQGAAPVDNDPLGILKKKSTPVVSSVTPSPLPSQPSFPQQGFKSALSQGASLASNSFLKEISKSIPKGKGEPAPVEGKWSNEFQNLFANIELVGTKIASGLLSLSRDIDETKSKYSGIPNTSGPLINNVIRGLHGNEERMNLVIQQNPLPNTFWGKAVSSVNSFVPDIIGTAALPEAKLIQGAGVLAKAGNLLFNNFTKYMTAKEGVVDYGKARQEGKGIGQATVESVKGAGKGMVTGMEMALLGAGSNMATKSVMNQAEKFGLTGLKGMAFKEFVNLNTDVLAFGLVSPFSHAALEGRLVTAEEIANGTGIAALFRVKGGLENVKSNAQLNKALRQTQEIKQGVAISNFVDATPESIIEVYKSPKTADELHLEALVATKKAKETTDLQKKSEYITQAITFTKASNVKQATDMVISNKDNFAELKASNDLPESAKKEFLEKAEEINNLLNPLKKQEVDLDNKIKESEDLSSQFSQQAQQSQDPNQRAELEAKAREAKDNADNLRGQLTEVKFNQNRPDANAGKEPVMEGEVFPTEVKVAEGIESKKADIEKRRQEELSKLFNNGVLFTDDSGKIIRTLAGDEVDAKYDAELSALETGKPDVKPTELKVTEEVKPTEVKVTEEVKDLSKSSEVELEKRLLEIEDSKSGTPERDEFNNIDKELEKREWRKVFDSPLDKVTEVADELIKKNEEQPSGFGSYIESSDARSLKLIANKYSKENVKKLTDSEIIKDYKDAMFGNPTSWYSDGLRLRESVKEAQNRGIDVFKELSKEFVKDGYSEQDAMDMAKRKLEPILKDLIQSSEKPLGLEQKPTEVKAEVKPTEVKSVKQLREQEQAELDSKIPNAEQYRVDGKVDRAKLTNEADKKAFDEVYEKYDKLISPLLEKPTEVKEKEEKTFAQKDLDRAEAKKIHSRVAEMEPPSDAAQVALRYLAEGGKVSQDAINEVSGTTKRASLNTGRRELKTEEAKARDYAGGKESLDDLAHRLWEASGQKISERDIKDALMSEIGNNNTRLDASKSYLERYSPEYQEEQYYNRLAEERKDEFLKEQDELEKQLRKPLDEQIEGEASEEHINNLIKQYEAEFERENKQLESEGKGKADKEIGGRDGGKEGLKEEYEKIKSNKKKKDFVRDNLPEEFKSLVDELTDSQMSEIVKSDFDLKTIKDIQDAVQKQSAAEVLQPKQEEDGGTRGERKRVEQGKQGDELTGEGEAKTTEEAQPKGAKEGKVEELKTNDKSILNRINSSENIPDSVKEKFKDNLKYEVKSKDEAKSIAKNIIKEYGTDNAVTLAESNKFHGDVNSFIFSEAINDTYIKESEAKTPEEKLKYAEQWADYAVRFDESARSKGRFISAISDFYKKSPLGMKFVENERRTEDFKKWYKGKEGSYKEVFDELVKDPQFKSLIGEEVQKGLKEERAAQRESNRKKIEDFFDNAKLKGNNLYAVPIPPKIINGALEVMKQAVLAGESVVYAVNQAVEHISKEVKDWDKEKFRKEYEEKLSSIEGKGGKKAKEELPEDAKSRILEKFRKKLKGLDESQKEKVIRKSFKTLVENGALEYNDFKKIIAETIGYGEVTPEEAAKITKLVNDINSVDELASSIRSDENRSEASLLKYQKAKKEAEKSATELNKMVYNKTNISNRLLSIMQLNTLGIPSLVNNPVFNIWNQATVRFPNAVSMTVLDQILYGGSRVSNKLFGTDVLLPENNVVASQKEFFKKLWQGGKLSTEQLFTGLTNRDYFQKEIYSSQIHPFTSAKDLWDWKFNGKNLTPAQVADKSIQATVGLPAEIVARALNIGDKPQRFAAEGAQAAVFAKNLGLKDIDYKYFLEFPKEEAYRTFKKQGLSDEAAMKKAEEIQDRIIKQGEESTFQQENLLNDMINAAFNKAGTAGDIFKRFNMPFLKIPLNAFWSSYNLVNPEVAFLQSAVYGVKAIKSRSAIDIQQSKKWFAHGVTGIALTGIAGALVSNGIVNSDNRNETTKKERLGEKTYEQQNSINVTKLNAYLRGENPDDVKNSLNVDLKWFGNVGNVLNVEALKQEEMTPEQRKDGMSYMEDMFSSMKISSMELIENGVFSSTSGLLTAIDKGGSFADSYFLNLINMGTNIVQPAMFAQMSRAQLPYYSQQKADTFMEQIKNNLLTRSSTVRALSGKYPPSQIGVWGDVLDRKDNFAMKLFGISSNNKDNFAQPIYEDYKKTDNTAFLPPSVKPEVNGFELNTSQSKQFEIMVGQARKNLAAPFVNDGAKLSGFKDRYSKLSEEDKVKALGIIYKMGYQVAEDEFTKLYPQFYKSNKKTPEEKKESKESSIFRKSLKKFIK